MVIGGAGNAVIPFQRMMARNLQPEGQVLAGPVAHHRAVIPRAQDEGGDDIAFPLLTLDDEVAPSVPATRGCCGFTINLLFAADQNIGEEPVGLTPGGQDFIGRRLAQDILDGAQKRLGDGGIVLGQDLEPDMLLRDPLDRRPQYIEPVDILRIGQNCGGEGLGLGAGVAVVRLIEQVSDRLVREHTLIHAPGDIQAMGFQDRDGRFDQCDGLRAQGC
jgi:hypothetical protein